MPSAVAYLSWPKAAALLTLAFLRGGGYFLVALGYGACLVVCG